MITAAGMDAGCIKHELYIALSDYEISMRCTEVAVRSEERNQALIKKFLTAKIVKGCSNRTIQYYGSALVFILNSINKTVDDITADDIRLYIALRMKRDHVTEVTIDNEIRILRSFYAYLCMEEIVQRNIMLKVDKVKAVRQRKEAFTEQEIEKLRYQATQMGAREEAIVELLLSTGARVTELCNIRLNEMEDSRILVHGKGKKDRYVYVNIRAMMATQRYMGLRKDDSPYLFPGGKTPVEMKKRKDLRNWWIDPENLTDQAINPGTIETVCRKIAQKCGIEHGNPHKYRRTCATMALKRGMPIEQVSKMLGHEDLKTTMIYLDLSEEDLRHAHEKYVL